MLIFPKHRLVVIQPPRTGSTSRRTELTRILGFPRRPRIHGLDHRHLPIWYIPPKFSHFRTISFVRDPIAWLQSYWTMRHTKDSWQPNFPEWLPFSLDDAIHHPTFHEAVFHYIADTDRPMIRTIFESYTTGADFILNSENQDSELPTLLQDLSIPCPDYQPLRRLRTLNKHRPAPLPESLAQDLRKKEGWSFDSYNLK